MKKSSLLAALAASVIGITLAAGPAVAQQPPVRTQNSLGIALVDINYIFKKHPRFKAQMDDMRKDIEQASADLKRHMEAVNKKVEMLQGYNPGTQDYKTLEEEIVNDKAKLQGMKTIQQKEFFQREAKIYYNIYQEVMQEVQYYATANNIALVLSFNGDRINAENPDDVLRGISRQVVYYHKDLDITPYILNRIGAAVTRPAANTLGVPYPR